MCDEGHDSDEGDTGDSVFRLVPAMASSRPGL